MTLRVMLQPLDRTLTDAEAERYRAELARGARFGAGRPASADGRMSDAPTKLLDDRIAAIIERVKVLAAERDACRERRRSAEVAARDANEREHARLRTVVEDAVRELRQE